MMNNANAMVTKRRKKSTKRASFPRFILMTILSPFYEIVTLIWNMPVLFNLIKFSVIGAGMTATFFKVLEMGIAEHPNTVTYESRVLTSGFQTLLIWLVGYMIICFIKEFIAEFAFIWALPDDE